MANGNIVRFFFGQHATEADAETIRKDFQWCSVYVPEMMGWTFACHVQYRAVTRGDVEAYLASQLLKFNFTAFHQAELEMIEGSERRVEFIDVPGPHPLCDITEQVHEELLRCGYLDCDWYLALQTASERAQMFVRVNQEREKCIMQSLQELDAKLSGQRILVRLGTGHVALARAAAQLGLTVQQVFQRPHPRFTPETLLHIYLERGRPVPRLVLAQFIFQQMLIRYWLPLGDCETLDELIETKARVTALFSEVEIADLWQRVRADQAGAEQVFFKAIRDKGFVPKTQ